MGTAPPGNLLHMHIYSFVNYLLSPKLAFFIWIAIYTFFLQLHNISCGACVCTITYLTILILTVI